MWELGVFVVVEVLQLFLFTGNTNSSFFLVLRPMTFALGGFYCVLTFRKKQKACLYTVDREYLWSAIRYQFIAVFSKSHCA